MHVKNPFIDGLPNQLTFLLSNYLSVAMRSIVLKVHVYNSLSLVSSFVCSSVKVVSTRSFEVTQVPSLLLSFEENLRERITTRMIYSASAYVAITQCAFQAD